MIDCTKFQTYLLDLTISLSGPQVLPNEEQIERDFALFGVVQVAPLRCCHVLRRKEHGQKSHIFIAFRTPEDARQAHEDCISDSPNVKWVQDFDSSLGPNRCSDELGAKWQQFVGLPPSPSRTVESLMDFGAKPELGAPADEANLIVSKLWSAIDWRQTLEDQNLGLSEVLDQDIYQHSRAWNRLRDVSKRCEKLANGEELSM